VTHLLRKTSLIITLAVVLATGSPVAASAVTHHHPHPLVSAAILRKTLNVHNCEEPVWNVSGPQYFGGLGWLDATWLMYKAPSFPRYMSQATIEQQAWAMAHFVAANGGWWPDQGHCTGGY
jgi:hypothetical protein